MLHIARLETQPITPSRVDLSEVSLAAIARMAKFALAKSVHLKSDIMPQHAIGNGEVFERVITSLLHNAIKFAPANGHVEAHTPQPVFAELCVRDNGPGFTEMLETCLR